MCADGPTIDIDLHGWIGLRLIDPAPADLLAVESRLGPVRPRRLARPPDLQLRFVRYLPTDGLRHVAGGEAGFTDAHFFVRARGAGRVLARVDFDAPPGAAEIVCRRGAGAVPLLLELLRVAVLDRGVVGVHASAFEYQDTGVLVLGWPHGGKTSALLAFAEAGARLVGDDLVFLADGGRRMFGLAAPMEVSDWQLRQVPRLRRQLGASQRLLTGGLRGLDRIQRTVPDRARWLPPARLLRAALPALERRLTVRLPSETVFPGAEAAVSQPDRILLMVTHAAPDIRVEAVETGEAIQRVVQLAHAEMLPLLRCYFAFRFAFPARTCQTIEDAPAVEAALLHAALAGREVHMVRHPRPVSLRALRDALSPLLRRPPLGVPAAAAADSTMAADRATP